MLSSLSSKLVFAGAVISYGSHLALAAPGDLLFRIESPEPTIGARFGDAVALLGTDILIGAPGQPDLGKPFVGEVFQFDGSTVDVIRSFSNPQTGTLRDYDAFGSAIAVVGDRIVIGAPGAEVLDSLPMHGKLFIYDANNGLLVHEVEPDVRANKGMGSALTVAGTQVLAGISGHSINGPSTGAGAVYVFNASTGQIDDRIFNPTLQGGGLFGRDVAASSDMFVAGAHNDALLPISARHGLAHVFDSSTHELLYTIENPNPDSIDGFRDNFGLRVAISEDFVFVASPGNDIGTVVDLGSVYAYDSANGSLRYRLDNPTGRAYESFGFELTRFGDDDLLIGAVAAEVDGIQGAGIVYLVDGLTGNTLLEIPNPEPEQGAFGTNITVMGDKLLISKIFADLPGVPDAGVVYVFDVNQSPADFDRDFDVDVDDVDALVNEIVAGNDNGLFDLTGDGILNEQDLEQWLATAAEENGLAAPYLLGDANLDGTVNASDLNALGQNWLGNPSAWQRGDFTADGTVDANDLNQLARNWQASIAVAMTAVPEPGSCTLLILCVFVLTQRREVAMTQRIERVEITGRSAHLTGEDLDGLSVVFEQLLGHPLSFSARRVRRTNDSEDCRIGRGAIRFGCFEKNDPLHRFYPWLGRDEKDSLGVTLRYKNTVQADVVDIDAMRRVNSGLFVATVDAALVAGSFDFDPRGRRCAGDDFDNG